MPSWYIHTQAAAQTLEGLNGAVPAGSPLSAAEAMQLFTAGHDNRNYLAAGALGPDLFFLLPDFKGDLGTGLMKLMRFALGAWQVADKAFVEQWETWMAPVLDEGNQLADGISGGMLGEIGQVQVLVGGAFTNMVESLITQTEDIFGLLTSGTQAGYEDSSFFWSDAFHYRKTYHFARTLYKNAMNADAMKTDPMEPSRVPKQQAFALGWISHCAADVAGHPFTNAKVGGPYRTHWQRHHVVENHMDALVYRDKHGIDPMASYSSLDTSALHFRLSFQPDADPAKPEDAPTAFDWFPSAPPFPPYPQGEDLNSRQARKNTFDVDSAALPEHICQLLIDTMKEVYGGPGDMDGPQVLSWDGPDGRPTVQQLQDMYDFVYKYVKYSTSSGLSPRMPKANSDVITDHDLPRPPGFMDDSMGADPNDMHDVDFLDVILAILAFALWLAELTIWLVTILPALLNDLLTWPTRELIHELLVLPAWSLYMASRTPLVMEGFLMPRPEEISMGLTTLGQSASGPIVQLRADLDDPTGFAALLPMGEPSGLDAQRGAATQGFSLDPAYPRAMLTDLFPPFLDTAPWSSDITASEFVAPWRYPDDNMAGRRNGWEAPRTHVGPYLQGDDARVLMDMASGSDAARRRFEDATTPDETEAVSAELIPIKGENLGDPIDYGAYLMGQLTGTQSDPADPTTYVGHDQGHPLPDFNLDSDRGYAYHCWDYVRHLPSTPGSPHPLIAADSAEPDQWRCAPKVFTLASQIAGAPDVSQRVRDLYGYAEPCTVPQRYDAGDNIHHRSRYDPLKLLAHHYLPPGHLGLFGITPTGCDRDFQVTEADMRDATMSPTGRPVP
jgi:hypothetical protein